VAGTASETCPMACFHISSVEPSDSATKELYFVCVGELGCEQMYYI
jgi:hypothetical protein